MGKFWRRICFRVRRVGCVDCCLGSVSFGDFLQMAAHIAQAKSLFTWENAAQGNRGTITVGWDRFVEMTARI